MSTFVYVNLNLLLLVYIPLRSEWYKKHDRKIQKRIAIFYDFCGNLIGVSILRIIMQIPMKRIKSIYACFPEI